MGAIISFFWTLGRDDPTADIPDAGTGLTPREKKAVRQTWALVKSDYKANGIALFLKFFKAHPDYQKHFKGFATVPYTELATNPRVHAHAASVLYAITSFVDNLDDVACLKEMLLKTAKNHYARGIVIKQFENLAIVILGFLQEQFGSQVSDVALNGWTKVFEAVNSIIGIGLEQAAKGKIPD